MDDYTGMRTIEEKDGKSHFQLEEKGEKKKKDDLRIWRNLVYKEEKKETLFRFCFSL